jgi:hypothetical protein
VWVLGVYVEHAGEEGLKLYDGGTLIGLCQCDERLLDISACERMDVPLVVERHQELVVYVDECLYIRYNWIYNYNIYLYIHTQ